MASSKQVLLLAVVAAVACLASLASATVYMVGDDLGWRAQFNQTGWADGKTFVVGDSLMFLYDRDKHTVAQVGKDDFAECNLQGNPLGGPWDTGSDVVTLDKPGKMWFICTVQGHCDGGMKLAVDVLDPAVLTPAPAPAPVFRFPWPFPSVPAPAPAPVFRFPWPFPGVPAPAPAPVFRFPWPLPAVPAPAPAPVLRFPWRLPEVPAPAPAPVPWFRSSFPWGGSAPGPAPPVAAPPSAAVRNPVSGAVAAAAAVVVAAALAF